VKTPRREPANAVECDRYMTSTGSADFR
jgi:hypothetical protein